VHKALAIAATGECQIHPTFNLAFQRVCFRDQGHVLFQIKMEVMLAFCKG